MFDLQSFIKDLDHGITNNRFNISSDIYFSLAFAKSKSLRKIDFSFNDFLNVK